MKLVYRMALASAVLSLVAACGSRTSDSTGTSVAKAASNQTKYECGKMGFKVSISEGASGLSGILVLGGIMDAATLVDLQCKRVPSAPNTPHKSFIECSGTSRWTPKYRIDLFDDVQLWVRKADVYSQTSSPDAQETLVNTLSCETTVSND